MLVIQVILWMELQIQIPVPLQQLPLLELLLLYALKVHFWKLMAQHVHYALLHCPDALNVIQKTLAYAAQLKEQQTGELRIYKPVNMNVNRQLVLLEPLVASNVRLMQLKIIVQLVRLDGIIMDLPKCALPLLYQKFAQSQLDKPRVIGLMVQDASVIFITYVIYYLVCDTSCKLCETNATTCTECHDGFTIAESKCTETPPVTPNGTNGSNQTNGSNDTGDTTKTESSSIWKFILIGGVVLLMLAVIGGIVFFVMNKGDEERDEESEHEEELDTRRDDNYELTETKMDHHTMDRDMDH